MTKEILIGAISCFFKAPHCVMRCQCVKLEVVVTHTSVTLLAQILSDCLFGLDKNKSAHPLQIAILKM